MCSIQKMSEMTGLSEERLLQKKLRYEESILKSICMECQRDNFKLPYTRIAKEFNLSSHATVISNISMIANNSKHPSIKAARQKHKCFKQDEVCIIPSTISEAKEIIKETLEDILNKTSVFDKRFEEILRQIRNQDIRNSPQRLSVKM